MQCPYCGRDIPDDARWCPYCGAEQTPPENLRDKNIPPDGRQDDPAPPDDGRGEDAVSGWQDGAPADDWDDEAEPPDDSWADDAPVPGWEEDAPYTPASEDKDAPRSKALLIAIFAALGVALIVLLIALNVKPKPKDPAAAVTPVVTATAQPSAAPTPSAVPTPTPTPTPKPVSGSYILPDSATRRLTQADVAGLTWEQCCLARNEIYARHGRIFQTKQIAAYFEAQSWYHGTVPGTSFDSNTLSPIEHANIDFLAGYENATWGHAYSYT